tara:strand:- start:1052 stop:1243 length:192 start_codon:yes stop_codon:yes gene_type:complete
MFLKEPFKYSTLKGAYDSMRNQYDPDYIYNVEAVEALGITGDYWIVKVSDKSGDTFIGYLDDY